MQVYVHKRTTEARVTGKAKGDPVPIAVGEVAAQLQAPGSARQHALRGDGSCEGRVLVCSTRCREIRMSSKGKCVKQTCMSSACSAEKTTATNTNEQLRVVRKVYTVCRARMHVLSGGTVVVDCDRVSEDEEGASRGSGDSESVARADAGLVGFGFRKPEKDGKRRPRSSVMVGFLEKVRAFTLRSKVSCVLRPAEEKWKYGFQL